MVQISASLLAADYACLGWEVWRATRAGVDSFHLDIMDGHYVPNLALTPHHVHALRPYTDRPFSLHLEIEQPDRFLDSFGPLACQMVIVQADSCPHPEQTFAAIRGQGAQVGLAVNPEQAFADVCHLLPQLDLLLVMGVPPGFGGQPMAPHTLTKVVTARAWIRGQGLGTLVGVDGGITPANAAQIVAAGADCLIIGTSLFQAADMAATVKAITQCVR